LKIEILCDIDSNFPNKSKGHKVNYAKKGEKLLAIERTDGQSILVRHPKNNFILFKTEENKKYKIIQL